VKLRLLGHDISVIYGDPGIGRDVYGSWDRSSMTIQISNAIHQQDQVSTLIHEIGHALNDLLDLGITESQIAALTQGLYQVLRDNPDMFKEEFKGEPC
jgi:hypothetical protein